MAKKIILNQVEIFLLAEKALFIPQYELLVISDWHLGKLQHFRRAGFFIPAPDPEEEFDRLRLLINDLKPKQVVFLGDLFHSEWNTDWENFRQFVNAYQNQVEFILTKGNHDILSEHHFNNLNLRQKDQHILSEGIILSHEPIHGLADYFYNIVGHIHPGVRIEGKGRQSFRLPCFFLQHRTLTMPAFGKFTGLHIMDRGIDSKIYAIINDTVMEI